MRMRERTCCFTGHRDMPEAEREDIMRRTEAYIRALAGQGVRFFGVGGAAGYDTEAAKTLFRLRDGALPEIRVILVYPYDGYTSRWPEARRRESDRLLARYDKVVRASDTPGRDAYLLRNRHLVDGSSCCVCYCHRAQGGTAYTVRYALRQGLRVYNTADFDVTGL